MSDLIHGDWNDDLDDTVNRYRKRLRREGLYLSTFLYVEPTSNAVERINRGFVSIRSDGGGNVYEKGMEANSTLSTIYATCKVRKESFYTMTQGRPYGLPASCRHKQPH